MPRIILSEKLDCSRLADIAAEVNPDKTILLTDSNVAPLLPPALTEGRPVITMPAGEENKNLDGLAAIWRSLISLDATRRSLLINAGGGVVGDIGGFAASTFKRGMPFINVATTLLAAADASIGGKTAIDFYGLKNQIGTFAEPLATFIPTAAWATLPRLQLLSGFGEIVKAAYLLSPQAVKRVIATIDEGLSPRTIRPLLDDALRLKSQIVEEDPFEHGRRAILNLGHTAGHAFESIALRKGADLPHGIAVAYGILLALILSHTSLGLPSAEIYRYVDRILRPLFPPLSPFTCDDYPDIINAMRADKKNPDRATLRFILLRSLGNPAPTSLTPDAIPPALDIFRDLLSL